MSVERELVRGAGPWVISKDVGQVSAERDRVRVAGPPSVKGGVVRAGLFGVELVRVELRVDMG